MEIFTVPDIPDLGYRLRVKNTLNPSQRLKLNYWLDLGWIARSEQGFPTDHIYDRSRISKTDGYYLGGPLSYVNHSKSGNLIVRRKCVGSDLFVMRAQSTGTFKSGDELMWNYEADVDSDWSKFPVSKLSLSHVMSIDIQYYIQ